MKKWTGVVLVFVALVVLGAGEAKWRELWLKESVANGDTYFAKMLAPNLGADVTITLPSSTGTMMRTEDLAAPGAIGGTTPGTGAFTTGTFGGGYGSTGATISDAGAISADGATTLGSTLQLNGTGSFRSLNPYVFGGEHASSGALTDSTSKSVRIGAPHYLNAEEPMGMLVGFATSSTNLLYLGGGTSLVNAVTEFRIYTAANNTTATGTNTVSVTPTLTTLANDLVVQGGDGDFGVTGTTRGVVKAYRGTSTNTPGTAMLEAKGGSDYYMWFSDAGVLRRHTDLPTSDTVGADVSSVGEVITFSANDTSPSIAAGSIFIVPGTWTAANNITAFDDAITGKKITIIGGDSDCVVEDGALLNLDGNWTAVANDTLELVWSGSAWCETSRSPNTP